MKKVLIVNTKYKIFGGEDANISDEVNLLKKQYNIELLEFDNSQRINIADLIAFVTNSNRNANKKLTKSLMNLNPMQFMFTILGLKVIWEYLKF